MAGGFTFVQTVPENPTGFWANGISGNDHTIYLHWTKVNGAKLYEIYGKKSSDNNYSFIASTDKLEYYVDGLSPNTTYNFELRPINDLGNSGYAYDSAITDTSSNSKYDTGVPDVNNDTSINLSGNTAIVTLGKDALDNYIIDLTGYKYSNVNKWIINVPDYFKNDYTKITLRTKEFGMEFTPDDLNLSSDYDRITIERQSGKAMDDLNKKLPKYQSIVSDIYDIKYDEINDDKISAINYFKKNIKITMNYYNNRFENYGIVSIRNFDAGMIYNPYMDTALHYVSADINYPGRYALVNTK